MKTSSALAGLAVAGLFLGAAWLTLRRINPATPGSTAALDTGVRQSWEPASFRTGDTPDYLAWVSDNYYGQDGRSIVLDARDARAYLTRDPSGEIDNTILDARDARARAGS
ncbi:MAG: hypothetical protein ACOYLX_00805 [Burkholderiaceae bacterium]